MSCHKVILSGAALGALLPLTAGSLHAQTTARAEASIHMLLGFSGKNQKATNSDPVVGVYDLDRNGKLGTGTGELFAFMKKVFSVNTGRGAFIMDMQHVKENGLLAFYLADSGDGYIYRCLDKNGNGLIDDLEVTVFNKFGTLQRTFSPNSLSPVRRGTQTIVYSALDSDTRGSHGMPGIHRSVDLNNDGDAADTGETTLFVSKASKLAFTGKVGTVTLAQDNWGEVRVDPKNTTRIIAYNSGRASATPAADNFCWYRFDELNGKLNKHQVFFNCSKLNGLPANADIVSGALVDCDIVIPATPVQPKRFYNGFKIGEVADRGYLKNFPAWYFTNDYGPLRSYGAKNAKAQLLNGVILKGVDKNFDGDLQDKGEVVIFFNGSGTALPGGANGSVASPTWFDPGTNGNTNKIPDFIIGMHIANGRVYIGVENGGADQILELWDKNGNDKIETGEVKVVYMVPKPFPSVFNATFGPWTNDLYAIEAAMLPNPFPTGVAPFGTGCTGTNGLHPRVSISGGSPAVGSTTFQVEMLRGRRTGVAIMFLGASKTALGAIPLPLKLDFLGMKGCFQLVSNELVLPAPTDAHGRASAPLPIPNDTTLKGKSVHVQFWSVDPGSTTAGITTSNAATVTIQ